MPDDLSYTSVSKLSEAYLEPAEAFKMVLYAKKLNNIHRAVYFLLGKKLHLKCLTKF